MDYKINDIVNAEPCYTGGGIYAIVGELADGNHFMGDLTFYWIAVVNEKPDWDESWYQEWVDAHIVEALCDKDAREFIKVALEWVKIHRPDGNYLMSDMDEILADIKETIILSSKEMAEKCDEFDASVLSAIRTFAESICGKTLDAETLSTTAYDIGILPQIQELAKTLIEDSYGFSYDTDGTSF